MNPNLDLLHPYPFQKLRELFAGVTPNPALRHVNLSIGEPKHATPQLVIDSLNANMAGLASYPTTQGSDALRRSISQWLAQRYGIPPLDIAKQVVPVNGSREALFAFAQAVIDSSKPNPVVISPNPFYQIYEGAALLAGAEPYFINTTAANGFQPDWSSVPEDIWQRTQLVYVCSPGNPTGAVMPLAGWQQMFELADRYGFVIASDECYSEIWFDEPPLGALQAAQQLGRSDYRNLVVFSSLSKRSNVPGMRSGFVAGDAKILEKFLLYRTYHGCAMNPTVQAASAATWNDEAHVEDNRQQYRAKFAAVTPLLKPVLDVDLPDAAFYLWAKAPICDTEFARELYRQQHVTVLPGSFLAREAHGSNPGQNYVRIALVAPLDECIEAARRIVEFCKTL
ncbi:MAG: N-succinyldiaminopimelate aminotransferase [Pseudomonadota bacterium]|nr:N-succinyldiaminopimelate aminotransferase [Pseudomonadota bacterium]